MVARTISINDIFERYSQAFGYTAMKITPRLIQAGFIKPQWYLNIPVYDNVDSSFAEMEFVNSLSGAKYAFGIDQLENGTPALPFMTNKEVIKRFIAPPPMVSFSRDKNVVITPIDRSEHEVIENFGNKAYQFNLQGILVDQEGHTYPSDLVREVHNLFSAAGTYKVTGDLFDDLEIFEIFFDSNFKIDFVEGYVDTVKFSVNARSVESAQFLIK